MNIFFTHLVYLFCEHHLISFTVGYSLIIHSLAAVADFNKSYTFTFIGHTNMCLWPVHLFDL
jgi:hypothetical protein